MSWKSGTEIAELMVELCVKYVPQSDQHQFLVDGLKSLQKCDWSCEGDLLTNYDCTSNDPEMVLVFGVIKEICPYYID